MPTFFDMHFLKNILRKWFSYLENAILVQNGGRIQIIASPRLSVSDIEEIR